LARELHADVGMLMNNPAARLHQILSLCKKHEKESGSRPMLMGWRKVFRMGEHARDFAVMERIGRVYVLAGEISNLVDRFEDLDPQLYLGWREELEEAFLNLSFRSEFDTFVRRIPRTLLVNIEFCSNALSERCPEPLVDPEKLAELNKLAAELLPAVQDSDLDEAGKRYFLDYLTLIRRAVDGYTFQGAPALQAVLDAATGSLATQRQVSIPTRETPIGKRFWGLTTKIAKALAAPSEEGEANRTGGTAALKVVARKRAA
jgi:hypothetical protein